MRCCHQFQLLFGLSRLSHRRLSTFTSCPPSSRPTRQALASLLQSCLSGQPNRSTLPTIHSSIVISGLSSDVFLTNLLLNAYSKSGRSRSARALFDGMPHRNLVSWSTLISMYAQAADVPDEALNLFLQFRSSSFSEAPNEFVLASVIRASAQLGDVLFADQVHGLIVRLGFGSDVYVGTSLVSFYSKVGLVDLARVVFDELPVRNPVTWTAIISGYTQSGRSEVSLELFSLMKEECVVPDKYVVSSAISACASSSPELFNSGRELHGYAYRNGLEMDVSVSNVLLDFYSKSYRIDVARKLFDGMGERNRNRVSWTTMIAGYMQNSRHIEAMELFFELSRPDAFACTSVMASCASVKALQQGRQVHAFLVKANLSNDEYVKNGLVDMYAKCDAMDIARSAFDDMVERNVVSYNTIIEGYAGQEELVESVKLFNEMRSVSLCPNLLTFVSLLGAVSASSQGDVKVCRQIHGLVLKYGESLHLYSGSALVDVYSKCGCVEDARIVFEELEDRDIVVWNAMIFGSTQNEEAEEAVKLYNRLFFSGTKPNEFTFAAILTAASSLASLLHGLQFHCQIAKVGAEYDPHVSNSLIDMYAKCGSLKDARAVFDMVGKSDVVCWNSMISRYADHGHANEAFQLFKNMQDDQIFPNHITFLGVLSACSHAGLVEDGVLYFNSMKSTFDIEPQMEHYACLVSLLGRAGRLQEAKEFIEQMRMEPSVVIWRSFLGACRVFGDVQLAKYAAKKAILMEPKDSGSYILLSNIFASREMWDDVKELRNLMDHSGVVKEPGYSWIEFRNDVHVFTSTDKGLHDGDLVKLTLDGLTKLLRDVSL